MKKTFKVIIISVLLVTLISLLALSGCDIKRKLTGAEMQFPKKISEANVFSFDMALNYKSGDESTDISMSCYKSGDEYAYDYYLSDNKGSKYRNLYADDCLYEILMKNSLNLGSYFKKENVTIDDSGNFLYQITQNILVASVATFISKAKKETLNGETVYHYDITLNEQHFGVWYNDTALVKLYASFDSTDSEGNTTSEEYTALFSNYKFEDAKNDAFTRPQNLDGVYVESPISFEDWARIINRFSEKIASI